MAFLPRIRFSLWTALLASVTAAASMPMILRYWLPCNPWREAEAWQMPELRDAFWSQDGNYLVMCCADGKTIVWDWPRREKILNLQTELQNGREYPDADITEYSSLLLAENKNSVGLYSLYHRRKLWDSAEDERVGGRVTEFRFSYEENEFFINADRGNNVGVAMNFKCPRSYEIPERIQKVYPEHEYDSRTWSKTYNPDPKPELYGRNINGWTVVDDSNSESRTTYMDEYKTKQRFWPMDGPCTVRVPYVWAKTFIAYDAAGNIKIYEYVEQDRAWQTWSFYASIALGLLVLISFWKDNRRFRRASTPVVPPQASGSSSS